ncbi:MAG: hypothetical protein LBV07_01475 [Syntrophobacterales bacterium]|jgi:flagellin-like hook-associated protein FlgL|nr:hypothetical protein [Syntrophobacterales bacterium]
MRVTSNMSYYMLSLSMNRLQESYHNTMEKIATQKRINRPSDDPLGMMKVIDYKDVRKSVEQYQANISLATSWLATAAVTLESIDEALGKIKSIAMSYASSTDNTKATFEDQVRDLTEQIYAFANNTFLGQYLFSGSKTETQPFVNTPQPAPTVGAGGNNGYTGSVSVAGGPFTGTANQTYAVRIVSDGIVGSAAFELSSDGGKTWVSGTWSGSDIVVDSAAVPPVALGLDAWANIYANDIFYVEAYAAGYYQGDDLAREVKTGANTTMGYTISGSQIFSPTGGVNLFEVLDDLRAAMALPPGPVQDAAINAAIGNLSIGREQVQHGLALVGIKDVRFKIAENHLTLLDKTMADLVDKAESSDIEELAMLLAMQKISLDATYSLAAQMKQTTILNFLR